jgi:nicotinamide-nucleotide amidase
MDVEIITIGDEIITGHTIDSNSTFIAQQLTDSGFNVKFTSSVGDNIEAMEEISRVALKRSHIVITTGGLGPTDDDLTKRAIVKVFKRNLVFHEDILAQIKERFQRRGVEMPALNQNQALLPQGARFFPNKYGSAVGICIAEEGRIFIALPGVPMEMKQIFSDEVLPYLKSLKTGSTLKVLKLRTTGIIESKLAEMITSNLKFEQGVRLAYLPSFSGVDLRVMASGATEIEADTRAHTLEKQIENICFKYIYGKNEETLEGLVGQLLKDDGKWLSVAESCTGGQLGMTITSVTGSSAYFKGGIVAYSNEIKNSQLGVSNEILNADGAVSDQCAIAMAEGVRKLFNSDYSLSITGIAGPDGGTSEKPVGLVFIGLASSNRSIAHRFTFGTERNAVRSRAVYSALELLRRELLQIS